MARRGMGPPIAAAVVALLVAIGFAATRLTGLQGNAPATRDAPAPEFMGIEAWLNAEPRALSDLRGKVVLIDFWTYSCINCIRTLPHLRALYEAYGPFGLEVIGVHAPEFAFERDHPNVRAALTRYHVPYPVALDNRMETWNAYGNRFWPHVYLIDARGIIRFDHIGEGAEEEIQTQVRNLMAEAGLELPARIDLTAGGPSAHITPEVYAGSKRGAPFLGNTEGFRSREITNFVPVDRPLIEAAGTDGMFFLEGPWRAHDEFIEAAGAGARVHLPFFARDVFMVAAGNARVAIALDGERVRASAAGDDVEQARVMVDRSDLFGLVRFPRPERHVLTLAAGENFRLYTFTFG